MKGYEYGMMDKDYQPSDKEFAGKQFGTANKYMERKDREQNKEGSKLRAERYKGRYD